MAKWGEGDPRWIVEDRPDTANVNNWHWTEKNALPWSRSFIADQLNGAVVEGPAGTVTLSDIEVEGEATANNRKGKLIFFYELVVKFQWKGKAADGTVVKGTGKIPNVSEENDVDEFELTVTLKGDETPAKRAVKELVRKDGFSTIVLEKMGNWYKGLRNDFTQGMILPTKDKAAQKKASKAESEQSSGVKIHNYKKGADAASSSSSGEPTSYSSFTLKEEFRCSPQDIFRAFLEEDMIKAYTQADAKVDSKVGGQFSMFGGNVTGTITDLVPYERIAQMWRFNSWSENHFSQVTLKFTEGDGVTYLTLEHKDVPVSDLERTKSGWQQLQFQRMKGMFGWGSMF